jgi:hypothetical protein
MGAFVVGFRYRRNAGVGVSSSRGGMRSSVKGTCGSIVIMDLVRKSSGVIRGVVSDENDFAAERKARSEAVKFDLKADFRGMGIASVDILDLLSGWSCGFWKTRKSNSSMLIAGDNNGWSSRLASVTGSEGVRTLFHGDDLRPREPGVTRELRDGEASLMHSSSSDGIDSLDTVLADIRDSCPLPANSSSNSSGGHSRKSNGLLLPSDALYSFSETPVCSSIASTVNLWDRIRGAVCDRCAGI